MHMTLGVRAREFRLAGVNRSPIPAWVRPTSHVATDPTSPRGAAEGSRLAAVRPQTLWRAMGSPPTVDGRPFAEGHRFCG